MGIRDLYQSWAAETVSSNLTASPMKDHLVQLNAAQTSMRRSIERDDVVTDPGWALPIQVDGRQIEGRLWDGLSLSTPLAFDTETSLISADHEIPDLALLVASDGQRHVVVLPGQLPAFIGAHLDTHWVAHNLAFDYFVLLNRVAGSHTARMWQDLADRQQLHCSLTLAQLVDVAEIDDMRRHKYGLAPLAERHLGLSLSKNDPYRCRFGELIGHDFGASPLTSDSCNTHCLMRLSATSFGKRYAVAAVRWQGNTASARRRFERTGTWANP